MAGLDNASGLPSHEELYPRGVGGWVYDRTIGWALGHKIASTIVGVAAAGIVVGSMLLTNGSGREATNTQASPPAQSGSSQTTSQLTASEIYYSQVRASLLQDVPDLANYKSALDYTTQRMVDLKSFYGLSLEQTRAPIAKWVQANITWDKKGERLVPFSEEIDFMPDTLFLQHATADPNTDQKTETIDQSTLSMTEKAIQKFTLNTETVINEHDTIWRDVKDAKIVEEAFEYLEGLSQPGVTYEGVSASFPPYVKAIREKGTFADKAHWTLHVKGRKNAPDEIRQHVGLSYILSVGGKAQIERWGFQKRTEKPYYAEHGDLAVVMSPELKKYLESDPSTFGHLLDPEYLGILPSREGVEAQGNLGTNNGFKIVAMWRELPSKQLGVLNRIFIYGDEATAIANGHR